MKFEQLLKLLQPDTKIRVCVKICDRTFCANWEYAKTWTQATDIDWLLEIPVTQIGLDGSRNDAILINLNGDDGL